MYELLKSPEGHTIYRRIAGIERVIKHESHPTPSLHIHNTPGVYGFSKWVSMHANAISFVASKFVEHLNTVNKDKNIVHIDLVKLEDMLKHKMYNTSYNKQRSYPSLIDRPFDT